MGRLGKVDPSSYSQPELITTEHSDIKWEVDFAATKLRGSVLHKFNVLTNDLDKIVSSLSIQFPRLLFNILWNSSWMYVI